MSSNIRIIDEMDPPPSDEELGPDRFFSIEGIEEGQRHVLDSSDFSPDEAMALAHDLLITRRSANDPAIKKILKAYQRDIRPELQQEVLGSIKSGVFRPKFLSIGKRAPRIWGKILEYTPLIKKTSRLSFFANPYSMAHQEPLILKQNAEKLISTEGHTVVLLGPAYSQKDLLYFEKAGKPKRAHLVDSSPSFLEIARRVLSDAGIEEIYLHNKNFMAGPNSVWEKDYYIKEILRDDKNPMHILSFGHGQFNEGMAAYHLFLAAMREVMRPRDTFGMAANLTQHEETLIAEYCEAVETNPKSKNHGALLWELFGKEMLHSTVDGIAGCTNLDLNSISWLPVDIHRGRNHTIVRLCLSAAEHPKLDFANLYGNAPYWFTPEIEFAKSPRPAEKLLQEENSLTRFQLYGKEMLRVQAHIHRPELKPDIVFMQIEPV